MNKLCQDRPCAAESGTKTLDHMNHNLCRVPQT